MSWIDAEQNPDVLAQIIEEPYEFDGAWSRVARNPHTPEKTLRELANRGYFDVDLGLANNTSTPHDILISLAVTSLHSDLWVWDEILSRSDLPDWVRVAIRMGDM